MTMIAAAQMNSGDDLGKNLDSVSRLVIRAAQMGARVVVLPENFGAMPAAEVQKPSFFEIFGDGPIQNHMVMLARNTGMWIVGGSVPIRSEWENRAYQRMIVWNDQGDVVDYYDKVHMFDVELSTGDRFEESHYSIAGERAVVVDSPVGRLGLNICYDLRFPELYRQLLAQGAEILVNGSAFTKVTGLAHWHLLLRCRAVENLCYMVAAAQTSVHPSGRETFGHSQIVDPWGKVVNELPSGEGLAIGEIDHELLQRLRERFPVHTHVRLGHRPDAGLHNAL